MANETPGMSLDYLARSSERADHDSVKPSEPSTTTTSMAAAPSFPSFHNRIHPPVAMSLRTRESSSMALKHIFDQINSSADNSQALDSLLSRTMPFRDDDGRRDGQGSSAAERAGTPNRAHESSMSRGSEELRETGDALQRTRGIHGTRSPPLEERNLFPYKSYSDARTDEDKRSEMSRRPSPQRSSDGPVAKSPAAGSVSWQDHHASEKDMRFGFRMPERIASPPPQAVGMNSPQANYKVTLETPEAASELSRQAASGGAPPAAFEHWRKQQRLPDLDLSFRKAQNQDPSTFFSNQTAFGSPISMPAHQSATDYNTSPTAPWSMQGPQSHATTNSATPSRPGPSNSTGRQPTAQLTIFYSGMVNVYDDVPADKAHAIMLLAGTGNSWSTNFMSTPSSDNNNNNNIRSPSVATPTTVATAPTPALPITPPSVPASTPTTTTRPPVAYTSPPAPTTSTPVVVLPPTTVSVPPPSTSTTADAKQTSGKRSHAELPHARKASLARFLEKRKDRVQVKQQGSPMNQSMEETCDMSTEKPCSPKRQCTGSGSLPSPSKNSGSRGRCSSPSPTHRSSDQPMSTSAATTTNAFPPQHRFVD